MTDTDSVLAGLRAQFDAKYAEGQGIIANKASDGPALAKAETLFGECEGIQKQMSEIEEAGKKAAKLKAKSDALGEWSREPVNRIPRPGAPAQPAFKFSTIEGGESEFEKLEPTGGFKSLGHFAWALCKQGPNRRGEESAVLAVKGWEELQKKAPSGQFEDSDPDGGILVPREFSNQIYERAIELNSLLSYLNPIPISGNAITLKALKENSRADGFRNGGIQSYWIGEADSYTSSSIKFRDMELKLHKLTVLMYCTDELLADSAGAIQAIIMRKVPNEINFKINDAILRGDGVGKPKGILNSGSKITASAVSGQGANTIVWANILAMSKRMVTSQQSTAIWLYNQDARDQLSLLYMPTGTAGGVNIFTPNANGGFNFYGRPALAIEQAESLGTEGDLILFSPEGYAAITKGGIESFMSMHVRFLFDEQAFKWRFRFDGQPYDDVALTPYKGSTTQSSIVTLSSTRT